MDKLAETQTMQYRRLGRSGLRVSVISLGTWTTIGDRCDLEASAKLLSLAWESGINLFDTAEVYGLGTAEEILGAALKRLQLPRETFLISTKVFFGTIRPSLPNTQGLSRKHVIEACHAALRRLNLEYLDLYLCHRPDPETPISETVRAMSDLIRQGKVLYWGTSQWSSDQIREAFWYAQDTGEIPPILEQPEYNLLARNRVEGSLAELCAETGLGLAVWSPLRSGLLTGKYDKQGCPDGILERPGYDWLRANVFLDRPEETMHIIRRFSIVAKEAGTTPSQLALAWVLRQSYISTAITGASKPQQLKENLGALTLLPLEKDLEKKLEELLKPSATVNGDK